MFVKSSSSASLRSNAASAGTACRSAKPSTNSNRPSKEAMARRSRCSSMPVEDKDRRVRLQRRVGVAADRSELLVIRAAAAFGRDPCDDLIRIGDVAGLAVHAVRGIDLQLERTGLRLVGHHLVDVRRAEVLARISELLAALRGAHARVRDLEMHGLILVVLRAR